MDTSGRNGSERYSAAIADGSTDGEGDPIMICGTTVAPMISATCDTSGPKLCVVKVIGRSAADVTGGAGDGSGGATGSLLRSARGFGFRLKEAMSTVPGSIGLDHIDGQGKPLWFLKLQLRRAGRQSLP